MMIKSKTCFLAALSLAAVASYGAKDSSFKVENSVKIGFDDNVFGEANNEQDSMFISDLVRATFKANFSQRTELLLYYNPEFVYRDDVDPDFVSYHDVFGRLAHQISQRASVTVKNRFRYQDKDGQTTLGATTDRNYVNNDLEGAVDVNISELSLLRASAGYEVKLWDDSTYADMNDFDRVYADFMMVGEVKKDTTDLFAGVGVDYLTYDHSGGVGMADRGGYDSVMAYIGADHAFSPVTTGNLKLGYQFADVDSFGVENDSSTPYLSAGIEHKPTMKTTLSASAGYSIYASNNQIYNAQKRMNLMLTAKHDITAKVNLSASVAYILSQYDSDFGGAVDADDELTVIRLRASYQINRNNFVDAGYGFTTRTVDAFAGNDYDRNRFDIGWRVSL